MNRNVLLLALSQAAMMTMISLVLASSALIGAQLASPGLATVPLAIQYLATLVMLYPASRLMEIYGRRPVFCAGAILGAVGLALAAAGIRLGSFALFAGAGFLIGVFNAVGQYYRFAAADAVPAGRKNIAISLTLTGGVLAAMAGPLLARWTREALAPAFFASFLALCAIALLGGALASGLRLPPMAGSPGEKGRSLAEIGANPRFVLAVLGGSVGYAIMCLLMTATPLAMQCASFGFAETATVIQWHVVAMFAPSFFTGALIQRRGPLPVMLAGCLLLLGAIGVSLAGEALVHYEVALVLLGVGWNFLYVGSTSLLTETYTPAEKSRVQAFNDIVVFLGVTVATFFSGRLVTDLGWRTVNVYAALPVLVVLAAILWQVRWRRAPGLAAGG